MAQLLPTTAHLNLRERFEPYKKLVAEVLLDKNPTIKTVINKTDFVGSDSAFRTFGYEVLAGTPDLDVEVRENGCIFSFNYAKVYWNSKLESEHTRLVNLFRPGEVVVDVMAGIGPFAVPAGKKGVFVWANDMNPESFHCLEASVARNKVGDVYLEAYPWKIRGKKSQSSLPAPRHQDSSAPSTKTVGSSYARRPRVSLLLQRRASMPKSGPRLSRLERAGHHRRCAAFPCPRPSRTSS